MWLEYELLTNPDIPGCFCVSTSYREEENPKEGRHELIFPMFEFEMPGTFDDLLQMENDLASFWDLSVTTISFPRLTEDFTGTIWYACKYSQ